MLAADRALVAAPVALRVAVVSAGFALTVRGRGWARAAALLAIGAAAACGLAARLDEAAAARPAAPIEATLEGTVTGVRRGEAGLTLELAAVRAVDPQAPALPKRISLHERIAPGEPAPALAAAQPGQRLRLRARLRAVEASANPGSRDREREAARRGIGADARLVHADLVVWRPDAERWMGARLLAPLERFRRRAGLRLARVGPGGGLLRALALGDRGGLGAGPREDLRRLGLSHLLAVSGLHLLLVAAALQRLVAGLLVRMPGAGRRPDPRPLALVLAGTGALGYALLAGWGIPVRRALAMLAALAAGAAARRPVRRGAPLVAAALGVLLVDPAALFEPGAQLSFAATAGLLATPLRVTERPARPSRRRRIADALGVSAAAAAATAPIAAGAFGSVSPWGLLANLVAVPWTALVLLPAALLAALAAGLAPHAAPTRALVGVAAQLAAGSLAACAALAAHLPVLAGAPPAPVFLLAAAAGALVVVRTAAPLRRAALACVLLVTLALAPPAAIEPRPPRVVALDVGQGDATLVEGREGALLVDAGLALPGGPDLGERTVVPALRALGVRRLALLVVSHGDLDHRGGVPAVLRAVAVGRLWLPYGAHRDPAFAEVLAAARRARVPVEERGAGAPAERFGDLRVTPLWPPRIARPDEKSNDRSLTLRVEIAGRRVLLPGDLEADAEARLLARGARLRADVLKLGHHGSRTSSTEAWLVAVGGAVAVASAPRAGRFGMPHPEVVARAHAAGYALWWTGRDGAVLIGLAPVLNVRGWRQ